MTNSKTTTPADNETTLACRLAMAEAALSELSSRVMAIKDLASLVLDGDETGALTVSIAHLAAGAGICIDQYEADTCGIEQKADAPAWLYGPHYLESRSEYKRAVAQSGGAA